MTNSIAKTDTGPRGGFVVRRPRASDAIGSALRGAFAHDDSLPCDIACALNLLDRLPG